MELRALQLVLQLFITLELLKNVRLLHLLCISSASSRQINLYTLLKCEAQASTACDRLLVLISMRHRVKVADILVRENILAPHILLDVLVQVLDPMRLVAYLLLLDDGTFFVVSMGEVSPCGGLKRLRSHKRGS